MSIFQKLISAAGKRGFDPNTPIGTAIEGGFFAGIITQGGDDYAVIAAPKASGESGTILYKTTNTASPAATQTLNNGPAATAAMVAAGSHPAAAFCAGLTINGFSDWYLPARDELELLYRNLKPTTTVNTTTARNLSSITYPEGNDQAGDTQGVNRNSNPVGAAYTSGNPAQTSVTDFVGGGTEALNDVTYLSSSEFSDGRAWSKSLRNGSESFQNKATPDFAIIVRAIRRVAI